MLACSGTGAMEASVANLFSPGDKVLVGKYSGSEVKLDGKEYLILKEDEVLGVVE